MVSNDDLNITVQSHAVLFAGVGYGVQSINFNEHGYNLGGWPIDPLTGNKSTNHAIKIHAISIEAHLASDMYIKLQRGSYQLYLAHEHACYFVSFAQSLIIPYGTDIELRSTVSSSSSATIAYEILQVKM